MLSNLRAPERRFGAVNGLDDVENGDLLGSPGENVPAVSALGRIDQTGVRERSQMLRQVCLRHPVKFGESGCGYRPLGLAQNHAAVE